MFSSDCRLFFWLLLLYFFNDGRSEHIFIHISQQNGNDTLKCLWNGTSPRSNSSLSCRSLDYAFKHVIESNETNVDIIMTDVIYWTNETVRININQNRTRLNLSISSAFENFSMRCWNESSGLFDINAPNLGLEFRHITFEMCGRNKTLAPAIMINNTLMVSFFSCTFLDNLSAGLFTVNTAVFIRHCTFVNNSVHNKSCSGDMCDISYAIGGAIGFLFDDEKRPNMSVDISASHFINNSVYVDNETYYVAEKRPKGVSNRGGAVHITYCGNSTLQSRVNIKQCQFEGNRATLGGALQIEIFEMSMNHIIEISECNFFRNYGSQVGGAFIMSLWDHSAKTSLSVTDVFVKENLSRSGSGIYIFLKNNVSDVSEKQSFLFRRVHIHNNKGPTGSGIKIASPVFGRQSIEALSIFEDCSFKENVVLPYNKYGYMASFLVDRVDIIFNGTNIFQGNGYFGAAHFSNSMIHVHGKLDFIGNVGETGGALMLENSQIMLYPESQIRFLGNQASMYGGAIYVVSNAIYRVAVKNNPECFLTYTKKNISPKNWKAIVVFKNNTASLKGAAINIDSLILCGWDVESKGINFTKSLKWSNNFIYEGNRVCLDTNSCQNSNAETDVDISTDVANLVEVNGVKELKIAPGESGFLNITAQDELNNSVFTLITGTIANNRHTSSIQWLDLDQKFYVMHLNKSNKVEVKYTLKPSGKNATNRTTKAYLLDLPSNSRVDFEFAISYVDCHPGFVLNGQKCDCDNQSGVIGCTSDGRRVQFKEGYWIGMVNKKFTVMPCPYRYCKCPDHDSRISACYFNSANWSPNKSSAVCENNRKGILCGECKENHSVGFQSYKCVEQKTHNAICTITSILSILLVILLCILILYFNPGLDNDIRGPLFFFQVLPIFYSPHVNNPNAVYETAFFVSSIFEFTIPFLGYFVSDCYLIEDVDNLSMLALSYISSVLALFVFSVAFFLSYKRVIHIRRKNAVQCLWLLLIFIYTSLTKTSLSILHCPSVNGELRLFAQGNVICYKDPRHVVMSIFAILILIICAIVIPLSIIILTVSNPFKVDPHYIDTLTNKMNPTCLWWWAVELLRRLLVVVLDVFIPIWNYRQVCLIFASVLILSAHCFFQPYRQQRANVIEAIFLLVLCGIAVFQMLELSDGERASMYMVILLLMFLCTFLIFIWKFVVFVRGRMAGDTPDDTEYENLDNTASTYLTRNINNRSVEERKERIDSMFSRADLSDNDD